MPRQAILEAPGTLYPVMIRGMEGKRIFRDIQERKDFATRLGDLAKQTVTPVLAWSLLGNHGEGDVADGGSGTLFTRLSIPNYRSNQANAVCATTT